jgi:SAM-dependent methyltransferase
MNLLPRDLAAPADSPAPAIEWEESSCLLCARRDWSLLVEAPDNLPTGSGLWFAVVQCQHCGLCFTNPRPSARSIVQFYPAVYRTRRAPRPGEWKGGRIRPIKRWCQPRQERRLLTGPRQGRLLDFGCGGGAFLERMHHQGWQVTGIDVSPAAIQSIRTELGLPALLGTLPHHQLQPASFDVITMWHSLEHVHNPREVLQQAYFLLAPGGKLLVAVPNIDSLPFRWFGSSWYGLDLPRHLTHFSPQTLQAMLERAGFHVGPMRMIRQSGWTRASAAIARHRQGRSSWRHWLRHKTASRLASWYSYLTGRCDCIMVTAERAD